MARSGVAWRYASLHRTGSTADTFWHANGGEALTAVSDWALRQPSVFRISAVCNVDNIASAGVLEKAGFTREGLLRRWMMHPNISDEPRDCWSYSRTR
jgi:[ribosomal protein S5]-alanine N-acetyltransferase